MMCNDDRQSGKFIDELFEPFASFVIGVIVRLVVAFRRAYLL